MNTNGKMYTERKYPDTLWKKVEQLLGVAYLAFSTDSPHHDPCASWACLECVLEDMQSLAIDTLFVTSDGQQLRTGTIQIPTL